MKKFTITEDHLKLLKRSFVFQMEDGSPFIDHRRPYGNSGIELDVAEVLGWEVDGPLSEEQELLARKIHLEMGFVLQICLSTLSFKAGEYVCLVDYDQLSWVAI